MKLSRFDLIDKLNAWTFEQEITCVNGDKKTVTVIAMEDVNQALDELMNEGDIIHIVSKCGHCKSKDTIDYVYCKDCLEFTPKQ